MRLTIRLLGAICVVTLIIIGAFASFQIQEERQRLVHDLERRAALLGEALKETLEPVAHRGATPWMTRLLKKFARPDRRIVVYDAFGSAIATAPDAPTTIPSLPEVTDAITRGEPEKGLRSISGRDTYIYATPLEHDDRTVGAVAVFIDASHVDAAEIGLWQYNAVRFFVLALGISIITLLVLRVSVTRPVSAMAAWAKTLKTGNPTPPPDIPDSTLFGPLALEVSGLARNLYRAKAAAEREAALRLSGEALWTEERLKQFARLRFGARPLFVVSNREPVSHVWHGGQVVAQSPASGVVTALEPVVKACGGVWVAHGSGDADRRMSDTNGRLGLPTDDPRYTLRRVWLSKEEEDGYYYGFANEGLWPLCHVVHARPVFRSEDWAQYEAVNRKFAAALLDEMKGAEAPMVLVQDYHFALLPAFVKAERPDARIAIFWHIPWPNFEAFAICPWQQHILRGMLAADLIGFHTQYHCNNFLESVERALEARIDAEHFAVIRGQHTTLVKPFPISVAPDFVDDPPAVSRDTLLARLGVSAGFLGVGVERVDYTKGLPERFLALERFFHRFPEYRGRVVFVQLAAPSRSRIPRYQELQRQVKETIDQVNRSFQTRDWRPIVYIERHHDRQDIWPFYRHADFCMVTSLHDGMNLVAKEFVSVRDDGDGVLILSRFTGASRELRDALLVNPYDLDETAEAIRTALEMAAEERRNRMMAMHQFVSEHNVYRWAGLLLGELSRIPHDTSMLNVS
jgi:trehalose-6-phosphate synthase/HAMP domain-containing protein